MMKGAALPDVGGVQEDDLAELHPFRGVRYNAAAVGDLSKVVTAPYDIISPEAQRAYYERSPYNVIRLEFGEERSGDTATNNRYTRAARQYREWLDHGVLRVDSSPGFYLYDEILDLNGTSVRRRSLIAPVRLAGWDEAVILPHEHTLPKPKADRLDLLRATDVQFSPIMAMYDDPGKIQTLLGDVESGPPTIDFALPSGAVAAAATTHRLWPIAEPRIVADLRAAFDTLQLYIADGHHRYETALAYRDERRRAGAGHDAPSEFAMLSLVETSDTGLQVWPTHRLLRDLGELDLGRVQRLIEDWFVVDGRRIDESDPAEIRALAERMLGEAVPSGLEGQPAIVAVGLKPSHVQRLVLRSEVDLERLLPDVPEILRRVDVVLLQRLIFERALDLARDEVEQGRRVQYTRDPDEAASAYAHGQSEVVFFLKPTPVAQLRSVVKAGQRFPQKTTYFYPKPVTGLVFFDEEKAW